MQSRREERKRRSLCVRARNFEDYVPDRFQLLSTRTVRTRAADEQKSAGTWNPAQELPRKIISASPPRSLDSPTLPQLPRSRHDERYPVLRGNVRNVPERDSDEFRLQLDARCAGRACAEIPRHAGDSLGLCRLLQRDQDELRSAQRRIASGRDCVREGRSQEGRSCDAGDGKAERMVDCGVWIDADCSLFPRSSSPLLC